MSSFAACVLYPSQADTSLNQVTFKREICEPFMPDKIVVLGDGSHGPTLEKSKRPVSFIPRSIFFRSDLLTTFDSLRSRSNLF